MTCGHALATLRTRRPLVQDITNLVAMPTTTHVVQAAGAAPAMAPARESAAEFATLADALTLNTGTPAPDWVAAMEAAADTAAGPGMSVVPDPVAAGAAAGRRPINSRLAQRVPGDGAGNGLRLPLAGIVAAFTAGHEGRFHATVGAVTYHAVAGELAAATAPLPGSLAVGFLNSPGAVSPERLETPALVEFDHVPL